MLGYIEKFTASHMYPHEYIKQHEVYYDSDEAKYIIPQPNDHHLKRIGTYNVQKKEYHLYDVAIFIIITVFMISCGYITVAQMEGSKGYTFLCVSLIVIFALLY